MCKVLFSQEGSVIASAAYNKGDFVYNLVFLVLSGECGRVRLAWVEAAMAFARFFICSSSATCSFVKAKVVI